MVQFTKSHDKNLTPLDAAKANAARLAADLTSAVADVTVKKSDTIRAGLAGDKVSFDCAKTAERDALHHLDVSRQLCEKADQMLAELESQLAADTENKTRSATGAEIAAFIEEFIEIGGAYVASKSLFNEVLSRALPITWEANGLFVFTASSMIEVPVAIEVVAEEMRQYGRAVLQKLAKAEMPKPAPEPAKVVPVAKEPLTAVFATRPIRWKDHDGIVRSSSKFLDCELPARTAAHALKIGAALPLDHPERKRNLGMWPGHVSLAMCFDLDAAPDAPPQHDPVVHSAFQPIDRGKPFTLKIAAGGS
jgi:hypothetical protein